jgi:predicted AAA+ superfamily ATPase
MIRRSVNILNNNSFFLFGARGTGKTRLIKNRFAKVKHIYLDLLDPNNFEKYLTEPARLLRELEALDKDTRWVVIDEIQKLPSLLDIVHKLIEERNLLFALTGSSARKLKNAGANLLAGRAFNYKMFPLTHEELGEAFDLNKALTRGLLPKPYLAENDSESAAFLRSYSQVYIKEEILVEQIVRRLEPFRKFLTVAAQMNGEIVNFSKIALDIGVSDVTVRSYFSILEDTLLGFFLEPYHKSVRKRQREAPKFYFFDTGVQRSLAGILNLELHPKSSEYGKAFEHFIILEIFRLSEYSQNDYQFFYVRSKDNVEIDIIIERPGKPVALVEIKSTNKVQPEHARHLISYKENFANSESYILSQDSTAQKIEHVQCMSWQSGIKKILCKDPN